MKTINMIGRPCPIPVVEAKKVLSQSGAEGVIVRVDNVIAVQNLEKMAKGLGCGFSWEQNGETEFTATILAGNQEGKPSAVLQPQPVKNSGGVTFLITADQLGIGGEEPGKKLIKSFLYSLAQTPAAPDALLLVNTGVKLAAQGSDSLDELKTLAGNGVTIIACGQCLAYYELVDQLAVGKIGNMLEIVEILSAAQSAITI